MKDYYDILGVKKTASEKDIKSAYRKLAMVHHPDKGGDAEKFNQIQEAYETLSDKSKRQSYDNLSSSRSSSGFGADSGWTFDDFVNNSNPGRTGFGGRRSGFGKNRFRDGEEFTSKHNPGIPDTKHLNIHKSVNIDLVDAINGAPIEITYIRYTVDGSFNKEEEEKTIKIHLDLRKKHYPNLKKVGDKYILLLTVKQLGNEDVFKRTNAFGEYENLLLFGNLQIEVVMSVPEDVELDQSNIIQYVDVNLTDVLFEGEKIRVTTIFDKSYDAEINAPNRITGLKFKLKGKGILSKDNLLGDYIIRFNVLSPDISKLKKKDLETLKDLLST